MEGHQRGRKEEKKKEKEAENHRLLTLTIFTFVCTRTQKQHKQTKIICSTCKTQTLVDAARVLFNCAVQSASEDAQIKQIPLKKEERKTL